MNNPTETRSQYESAILQQLIKNAEDLAVIKYRQEEDRAKINKIDSLEQKIDKIYSLLQNAKWLLITIAIGIVINIISPPFITFFNH